MKIHRSAKSNNSMTGSKKKKKQQKQKTAHSGHHNSTVRDQSAEAMADLDEEEKKSQREMKKAQQLHLLTQQDVNAARDELKLNLPTNGNQSDGSTPGDLSGRSSGAISPAPASTRNKLGHRVHWSVRALPLVMNTPAKAHQHDGLQLMPRERTIRCRYNQGSTTYHVDNVFEEKTAPAKMYRGVCHPLVKDLIAGNNALVLAYGLQGSGKSDSLGMLRSSIPRDKRARVQMHHGMVARCIDEVFQLLAEQPALQWRVRLRMYQLYNDKLEDMLDTENKKIALSTHDPETSNVVHAHDAYVKTKEAALSVIELGLENRRTRLIGGYTSNRSHVFLSVQVETRIAEPDSPPVHTAGELLFADLGGFSGTKIKGDVVAERQRVWLNQTIASLDVLLASIQAAHISDDPHIIGTSILANVLLPYFSGDAALSLLLSISKNPGHLAASSQTLNFGLHASQLHLQPDLTGSEDGIIGENDDEENKLPLSAQQKLEIALKENATHKQANAALKEMVKNLNNRLDDLRTHDEHKRLSLVQTNVARAFDHHYSRSVAMTQLETLREDHHNYARDEGRIQAWQKQLEGLMRDRRESKVLDIVAGMVSSPNVTVPTPEDARDSADSVRIIESHIIALSELVNWQENSIVKLRHLLAASLLLNSKPNQGYSFTASHELPVLEVVKHGRFGDPKKNWILLARGHVVWSRNREMVAKLREELEERDEDEPVTKDEEKDFFVAGHFCHYVDIFSVEKGHMTKTMKKRATNINPRLCFSIITGHRTIDFHCPSHDERDRLVDMLCDRIRAARTRMNFQHSVQDAERAGKR